jgi:streptogramin lyase
MPQPGRQLATILFLDIVASTTLAAQIGDARFRELQHRFYRIVRREAKAHGGHEEDTAGDGFFATYPNPTQAVRCACAVAEAVRELGVEVRAGVHTGEIETVGGKAAGIAVVIASRVMSLGHAGEVLVTSTTKDLVTGATIEFEDFSAHELKGVPGSWQVYAVRSVDGRPVGVVQPAAEAARRLEEIQPIGVVARRRRPLLALGIVGLVVVLVGVAGFATGTLPPRETPGVSVLAVDPATDTVSFTVPDGVQSTHRPASIYFDGSSLWQSTPNPGPGGIGEIVRRDPKTGQIADRFPLDTGDFMGFGFGYGWVAHYGPPRLVKVDPASGSTLATIALPGSFGDATGDDDTLWYLSGQGDLHAYDPITTEPIGEGSTVGVYGEARIVPVQDSVWICDCKNRRILRFDPASGQVADTIELDQMGILIGVDSADGATLWLLDSGAGTLTALDPRTGDRGQSLGVGGGNVYEAKIGFGSIWVAAAGELYRFRLPDGQRTVIEMPEGISAGGVALNERDGVVWVENCGCPDA